MHTTNGSAPAGGASLKRTMGLWMATTTRLRHEVIEVIEVTIAGAELGRERGGPRCMSCPIQREA